MMIMVMRVDSVGSCDDDDDDDDDDDGDDYFVKGENYFDYFVEARSPCGLWYQLNAAGRSTKRRWLNAVWEID